MCIGLTKPSSSSSLLLLLGLVELLMVRFIELSITSYCHDFMSACTITK